MFKFNVKEINSNYNFFVCGISSMIHPKDNTIMFLTDKNLDEWIPQGACKNCLIYVPSNFQYLPVYEEQNCIIQTANPRLEYALLVNSLLTDSQEENFQKVNNSYISEFATIGKNVKIEPFCIIGSGVSIGDETEIRSGTKIRGRVKVGKKCVIHEDCCIGETAFNYVKDQWGNQIRFPTLGDVIIGDYVEIGAHSVVERATIDSTIINNYVGIDSISHISHDSQVCDNTLIIGSKIGGHVVIGKGSYIGLNSTIRPRIVIGDNVKVGMHSSVIRNIPDNITVAGCPAYPIDVK